MIESQRFLPLNDVIIRIDGHPKDESNRVYALRPAPRNVTLAISLLLALIEDPLKIKMTAQSALAGQRISYRPESRGLYLCWALGFRQIYHSLDA